MPRIAKEAGRSAVKRVRFEVHLPEADEVILTGDFLDWDPDGIPLHHGALGGWSATLELPPGEYQYRLRVDGEWRNDPEAERRVPNPFGSENCLLTVE